MSRSPVKDTRRSIIVLALAIAVGLAIGYVDSRPTWDDTGITAGSILLTSVILSAVYPRGAWGIGLAVGVPVFAFNALFQGNLGGVVAIVIALAGAGIGYMIGKAVWKDAAS